MTPSPDFRVEKTGSPRFLENPCGRALLSDPGGIEGVRPLRRFNAAFRLLNDVGSRIQALTRLNHMARTLAVYASQSRSPEDHARLASGC